MNLLEMIAEASGSLEVGDIDGFFQMREKIDQVLLTSADRQAVDSIMQVLETAIESI